MKYPHQSRDAARQACIDHGCSGLADPSMVVSDMFRWQLRADATVNPKYTSVEDGARCTAVWWDYDYGGVTNRPGFYMNNAMKPIAAGCGSAGWNEWTSSPGGAAACIGCPMMNNCPSPPPSPPPPSPPPLPPPPSQPPCAPMPAAGVAYLHVLSVLCLQAKHAATHPRVTPPRFQGLLAATNSSLAPSATMCCSAFQPRSSTVLRCAPGGDGQWPTQKVSASDSTHLFEPRHKTAQQQLLSSSSAAPPQLTSRS